MPAVFSWGFFSCLKWNLWNLIKVLSLFLKLRDFLLLMQYFNVSFYINRRRNFWGWRKMQHEKNCLSWNSIPGAKTSRESLFSLCLFFMLHRIIVYIHICARIPFHQKFAVQSDLWLIVILETPRKNFIKIGHKSYNDNSRAWLLYKQWKLLHLVNMPRNTMIMAVPGCCTGSGNYCTR